MKILTTLAFATAIACAADAKSPQATNGLPSSLPKASQDAADIYKSVVRIETSSQVPDYKTPWNAGRFSGGTGTGFLIGKNQFLTNAHVVSNARRVLITMHGSARKHPARVVHIAHDCDLALLEVEDFSPFENFHPLEIGDIPKLESEVRAIGYPVGGERISVTRGVVSRIDFVAYSHSRADSHLVVQIDAAINPGNSGGPVLQDGKVVGVAFQGLTKADNTGYMIPTPVVERFLTDIKDGNYDEYVDLGIFTFELFNPAMRDTLGLEPDAPGVLVSDVLKNSSSSGILEEGDILTAIDGHSVDSSGNVIIAGERVNLNEIVERKFSGDTVKVNFIRNSHNISAELTLKKFPPSRMLAIQYGKKPRYIVQAGLVFQPLNINLYSAHKLKNPRVRRLFSEYINKGLYEKRKDILVLTRVLDDPINSALGSYEKQAVKAINGVEISTLQQAYDLLYPEVLPEFFEITLDGGDRPLIVSTKELNAANQRIQKNYGIHKAYNLSN